MTDPLVPRTRLRTRVTVYFLLAAAPGLLLSSAAAVLVDRMVAAEIRTRTRETRAEARRILADEQARVEAALDRAVAHEAAQEALAGLSDPLALEPLAPTLAPQLGLEILAAVPATGPLSGTLASSAHLPSAAGDDAPAFAVAALKAGPGPVGALYELVDGNPPRPAPALVGVRVLKVRGRARLLLYGGVRLDGHRLAHVARAGQATFVIEGPGGAREVLPPDAPAPKGAVFDLPLPALPEAERPVVGLVVDTGRLGEARRLLRLGAAGLGVASLLTALLAGAVLSRRLTRPIADLSDAARRVGAGDLEVSLAPRSDDEVGTLVRVFNRMTSELSDSRTKLARAERLAAWQQIARRVAHEIKNPLFPIRMSMETLRKGYAKQHPDLDEIVEESTRTVLEEVQALNRIVTEFSDFARLPRPQRAPVRPADLLGHVHALYKDGAPGVEIRVDAGSDPQAGLPEVSADRDQINRALVNLVKNAIEALEGRDHAEVVLVARAEARDGRAGVRLSVRDDGPGIPDEVRAQIFTPYVTTKATGTGLGLAIVARIAEEHDGAADVDSAPGAGTTVSLWLPAVS